MSGFFNAFENYLLNENMDRYPYNKIKKDMCLYFRLKKMSVLLFKNTKLLNVSKKYQIIDKKMRKIESEYGPILTYSKFMFFGKEIDELEKHFYEMEDDDQIVSKTENISLKQEKVNINKSVEVNQQEVDNKNNVIDELNSAKRKLLYKIRKMENSSIDLDGKRKKLLNDKKTILEIEKMILTNKVQDNNYENQIEYSNMIRKQKAEKSIATYYKLLNKGITAASIEDFFGIEQVLYFQSLGIDILSKNK